MVMRTVALRVAIIVLISITVTITQVLPIIAVARRAGETTTAGQPASRPP